MIEFIKHALGLCGEGHPNIFVMVGIGPFLILIKMKFNLWLTGIKNHLQVFRSYLIRNRKLF